jgi:hypothetical protein
MKALTWPSIPGYSSVERTTSVYSTGASVAPSQQVVQEWGQIVPRAAAKGEQFLSLVRQRCVEEGLGLDFNAVQLGRRDTRVVLRTELRFGNAWKGKRTFTLDVHADAEGNTLHVGWQLTVPVMGRILAGTALGQMNQNALARIENDPNTVRQINGKIEAFQQTVFLPTLEDLIAALDATPRQNGFLGA